MKKILFATTALAAVSVASGSIAQESAMMSSGGNTLNIGGYYEFGWASLNDDNKVAANASDSADAMTYGDSELYIEFENTADNGLTYGVQLDIEMVNGNRHGEAGPAKNAEESNIYVSGDFGTVHLGHDDGAYGRFVLWAPTSEGAYSQDDSIHGVKFLDNGTNAGKRRDTNLAHSAAGGGNYYEDNAKIVYESPSFNGFKFGASTRDADKGDGNPTAFGASYTGDIGPGTLTVKGTTQSNNAEANDKQTDTFYGIGYDMGAFSVTVGSFKGKGTGDLENDNLTNSSQEKTALEIGVGFKVSDALSIGASTTSSETEGLYSNLTEGAGTAGVVDAKRKQEGTYHSLTGAYTIAPGLKTTVALNQFEVEDNLGSTLDNEGSEIVWQVEMNF